GDYWNEPNFITPTHGAGVASEIAVLGADRTFGLEGNHDWWNDLFHDYIDPIGENPGTSGRTAANFPITPVGDRRCFYLRKGNLMFLCIGDNQNFSSPQGESSADYSPKNYNASGGYSSSSWRAFVKYILSNLDINIVVCTHHPLKN